MNNTLAIYTRTERGNAELIARKSALGAAANSLLVLIDGVRKRGELLAVLQRQGSPAEFLDNLHSGGYIEERAGRNSATPVVPGGEPSDAEKRATLYEELIAAAKAHLGLKGFMLHIKIEKAGSLEELRALVAPVSEAIAKASGMAPANAFLQKMRPWSGT